MQKTNIGAHRKFSLQSVQSVPVVNERDLQLELLCFEAGQKTSDINHTGTSVYKVIEGEAIVRGLNSRDVVGAGQLLTVGAGVAHNVENAGGGLLTVLAIRTQAE